MRTFARLSTFAALGAAALTLPSLGWASVCTPQYNSYVCPLGESGTGLINSTVTPSTQATPLAITSALSGARAGGAFGSQRTGLNFDGQTGQAAAAGAPRWNVWGALGQNQVAYSFNPARSSGNINLVLGGLDYTFNNQVVLGVALSDDRTRINTQFNNGSLNANGYAIAPYVAIPFGRNWLFDASLGWGENKISQADNALGGATVTGNTTSKRFFSSVAASYAANVGKMQWTGKATYLFSEDKLGQFTLSNNVAVASLTTRVAQVRLGGQLAYDAGGIVPYAGLTYIRDVQAPTQPAVLGQVAANDRDALQVAVGINFYNRGPLSGGVQYSQDTNRSQVKNNLFMANVAYRF